MEEAPQEARGPILTRKKNHCFPQTQIYLWAWGHAGVLWSSEGIFLFSGHKSNCYEIEFDLTIMSQEVNIICWPDGLGASL